MSVLARTLINAQFAPTTAATLYLTPASTRTIIDKFTATNTGGSAATVSVNLVPSGGAPGANNLVLAAKSVAAGDAYVCPEITGHILNSGDLIVVAASTATVTVRASGREIA